MNQIKLLAITMGMKKGQCIDLPYCEIREAASGDLQGMDRLTGARPSDVKEFIDKVSTNWEIRFTEHFKGYTITKL